MCFYICEYYFDCILQYDRKICLKMLSIIINVFWEVNLICLQTELKIVLLSVYRLLLNKFLWLFLLKRISSYWSISIFDL